MIDQLPIGSTIWPKDLCCNGIVRYIRAMHNQTGAAVSVHSIADGKAEAIEFHVEEKKPYCDKPLKNMKVKQNILVACITHGGVQSFREEILSFERVIQLLLSQQEMILSISLTIFLKHNKYSFCKKGVF